jgi:predicted transcriptional regulator
LPCIQLIGHDVRMRTAIRHLHLDITEDLFERLNVIAGRTGMPRTTWIVAALTEAEAAASWRLNAISRLVVAISDDQERPRVGEAYLAHDDVTLRALLERYTLRDG